MKKYLFLSVACLISAIIAGFLASVLIWGSIAIDGIICGVIAVVSAFMSYDFFMVYFDKRFKKYKIFGNDDNVLGYIRTSNMAKAIMLGRKKYGEMIHVQLDKMSITVL